MGCGCSGGKNKPKPKGGGFKVKTNVTSAPPPEATNKGMVDLPPPPKMDGTAKQRIKRLNKDAIRRMRGLG